MDADFDRYLASCRSLSGLDLDACSEIWNEAVALPRLSEPVAPRWLRPCWPMRCQALLRQLIATCYRSSAPQRILERLHPRDVAPYVPREYTFGMSLAGQANRGRINLRVDATQEAHLRTAAEANGETLTGLLLTAGAERATEVLERADRIAMSRATFECFVAALGVEPMPTLSRYAGEEPGPIPLQ